jgi:hypothetical protein
MNVPQKICKPEESSEITKQLKEKTTNLELCTCEITIISEGEIKTLSNKT